jgi:hypothetical protein
MPQQWPGEARNTPPLQIFLGVRNVLLQGAVSCTDFRCSYNTQENEGDVAPQQQAHIKIKTSDDNTSHQPSQSTPWSYTFSQE